MDWVLVVDYLRIWADADGESHFEEVTLDRVVNPAEHGVAELWVSPGVNVANMQFLTVQAVDQVPAPHNAPRRQFVVFLDGWVRKTNMAKAMSLNSNLALGEYCRFPWIE